MRLIDGDELLEILRIMKERYFDRKIILGKVVEEVKRMPAIEPEPKWKRLMMHLADLQLTYSPNWGANGCGDQKLYEFVTGLIDELQGWEEGE